MSTAHSIAGVLVRPVLLGLDSAYIMAQGALKSLGLVSPEQGPPPEEVTPAGRFAVLPARTEQWPELRVRLPDDVLYRHRVDSMLRRTTIWLVPRGAADLLEPCRAAAAEAWPEVTEKRKGSVHVWQFTRGGVRAMIKLTGFEDGAAFLGIGQKRTLS